ncbi:hypothetical protein Dda_6470 [Drechslerella dactyloides]|uniref:Uncharacterized protein n=1 Tax=Drechslerella dactyloides TaxID=74499 RepID=A0AAD6NHF9_DREDA|nr:hypothetical protein Dda_6470 [Drechslerella dactyloides]
MPIPPHLPAARAPHVFPRKKKTKKAGLLSRNARAEASTTTSRQHVVTNLAGEEETGRKESS